MWYKRQFLLVFLTPPGAGVNPDGKCPRRYSHTFTQPDPRIWTRLPPSLTTTFHSSNFLPELSGPWGADKRRRQGRGGRPGAAQDRPWIPCLLCPRPSAWGCYGPRCKPNQTLLLESTQPKETVKRRQPQPKVTGPLTKQGTKDHGSPEVAC